MALKTKRRSIKLLFASFLMLCLYILFYVVFAAFFEQSLTKYVGDFVFIYVASSIVLLCTTYLIAHNLLHPTSIFEVAILTSLPLCIIFFLPLLHKEANKTRALDGIYFIVFVSILHSLVHWNRRRQVFFLIVFSALISLSYSRLYNYLHYNLNVDQKNLVLSSRSSFHVFSTDSTQINPFEMRGKVVFLSIWNKSCGACIHNFPKIKKLQAHFSEDTNVVTFSLYGSLDNRENSKWFFDTLARRFSSIHLNMAFANHENFAKLNIRLFPAYIIIDKKGTAKQFSDLSLDYNFTESAYGKIKNEL